MIVKDNIKEASFFGGLLFYTSVMIIFLVFNEYQFTIKLAIGFILCFAIVAAIKLVKFKERPKKQTHKGFIQRIDASSFPSMHSMRSMFLALMIGSFFINTYIYILGILLALSTGFSRIFQRKHYLSDVIIGYVLGIILFYLLNNIVL